MFFQTGFRRGFAGNKFRFNRRAFATHMPNTQKQMLANYMKSQTMLPQTTSQLIWSINNHLMLENMVNSSLDELEENSLVIETEDLEDLSTTLPVISGSIVVRVT
ncbi:unnamed protein product [Moneuplotes crassus]|uniref:Uncharacterized protein n=1 Tax=Euplotes crassus TaxID=5936 RepID=A0AAD1XWE7_EUPCR|nr:unnamed protein product [Moneuplotes crassus]CAI2380698.1 unnamed protein product [Moneuplotes crassus]